MPERNVLALRVDENPNIVIAERSGDVPDVFWGQLRIEWGYDGDPARKIRCQSAGSGATSAGCVPQPLDTASALAGPLGFSRSSRQ